MIKAKITKNIIKKTNNSLGLTPKQIIIAAIAFAIGLAMYFLLKDFMGFTILSTLIFIEIAAVICFGVINIQGMNMFQFCMKTFKGADVRYYKTEGMFKNDISKK